MSDVGDIYLADLNDDLRRRVLVVSNDRFHRLAGRAMVVPELPGPPDDISFPWRVAIDDSVYAIDLLRSLPIERLLERVDRAPSAVVQQVAQVLRRIT